MICHINSRPKMVVSGYAFFKSLKIHYPIEHKHTEDSYVEQICDACDFLIEEADEQGGRILSLNIHPWMLGQPHRIGKLESVLEYVTSKSEVWSASAAEILKEYKLSATS